MSTALEILNTTLKDWIAERATTGAYARTSTERPCSPLAPHAYQWCAVGALLRASNAKTLLFFDPELRRLLQASCDVLYPTGGSLARVNDAYGYDAARAILEHARESLLIESHRAAAGITTYSTNDC